MTRKLVGFAATVVALLVLTSVARAATLYSVVDLGALSSQDDVSYAFGLNDLGQVVGYSGSAGRTHAFLWDSATGMHDLGLGRASDINTLGQVVGVTGQVTIDERGFVWDPVNGMQDLGQLIDLPSGWTVNDAGAINDAGQIVGWIDTGGRGNAYIWDPATGLRLLSDLPGYDLFSRALQINDLGQVVGWDRSGPRDAAVLWDDVVGVVDLGSLPGELHHYARDINNESIVAGFTGGLHAFVWANGVMTDLGVLPGDFEGSLALGIDDADRVVGYSYSTDGDHAFIWDSVHGIRDLNQLIDPDLGWVIQDAQDINASGQIIANGWHPVFGQHALLLNPLAAAEPATVPLVVLGLAVIAIFRLRGPCPSSARHRV